MSKSQAQSVHGLAVFREDSWIKRILGRIQGKFQDVVGLDKLFAQGQTPDL